MLSRLLLLTLLLLTGLNVPRSGEARAADFLDSDPINFNIEIRPILSKCIACHGPDEEHRESGLSFASRKDAIAELDSGVQAIVPGKPDASEALVRILEPDDDYRMPPADVSERLTNDEVALLRRWITAGAKYEKHWSLVPPSRPEVPKVENADWVRNEIDAFVLARLEKAGLEPEREADRYRLIRRVSLDLTGLPPTIEETDVFVNDKEPGAYHRLVDRLLASPRYGEKWARMWLDLARYADSQGYANDNLRTIWPYRDWVIEAFNRDLPYDQFTIQQLAGDMLAEPTKEQLTATAFHRNTMTNDEGGTDDEEFRHAAIVDRTNTTMQVWMAMTLGCAQCHTHKYDPLTHEEYYQFFAFFNQTEDSDKPDNRPFISFPTDEQSTRLKELSDLRRKEKNGNLRNRLNEEYTLLKEQVSTTPIMRELPADKQRTTEIAIRGSFLDKGEEVTAGIPAAFHEWDERQPKNRLGLAHWLVSPENPLTARVAVNRHWEKLFGLGIVETSEDFGMQGEMPSHPELLDWLAVEFIDRGWSMKELCRLIVTSATYRQSSRIVPEKLEKDPRNRLLARGPRHRLSAEQIRDYTLAATGLLSDKMFGPPVRPPQPKIGLSAAFGTSFDWEASEGENRHRRGLYTRWRRLAPYPSMVALDAPDRTVCTVRRISTNTPVGAFVTLNDPAFVEAAQTLAAEAAQWSHLETPQRLKRMFRQIVIRPPTDAEAQRLGELYQTQLAHFRADVANAKKLATSESQEAGFPEDRLAEVAAWTVVANVLLNLDEVLTQN